MSRRLIETVALLALVVPADVALANKRKVAVPDTYDGAWSIQVATGSGPCPNGRSYDVQIQNSEASYPGEDVDVDGSVNAGGGVQASITRGAMRAQISGSLGRDGSGTGTWTSTGSLFECSGNWTARRRS